MQGVLICVIVALGLTDCCLGQHTSKHSGAGKRQPNIVLVVADDLGYHDVSYHGSRVQTPTLDKLSKNGVRLENYYVQPICSPTRCQLMSGRYQIHLGRQHSVFENELPIGLPLDGPILPEKLRDAGYSTHLVGKWHLGFFKEEYMPNSRGFDTAFGYLGGHEGHYNHSDTYDETETYYLDLRLNGTPAKNYSGVHSNYMYSQYAVDLIKTYPQDKPLFLYLAYQAPHSPLEAPESYIKPYKDIQNQDRETFAGMVTMLDEGLANVTQALKHAGLWDDTLLIFTTDNGGNVLAGHAGNNYPLRGWKFSLWEGGIRAVGFVTGGDNIEMERGVNNTQLIHVSDWFPTLVGVAGGDLNGTKPLDGFDQWKTISTGVLSNRSWILHNIDPLQEQVGKPAYNDTFDTRVRAALRVGDLKILTGDVGNGSWIPPPEAKSLKPEVPFSDDDTKNLWLFNITADPEERTDLSDTRPDLVKPMLDVLLLLNTSAVPAFWPDKDPYSNPAKHGGVWGPWE